MNTRFLSYLVRMICLTFLSCAFVGAASPLFAQKVLTADPFRIQRLTDLPTEMVLEPERDMLLVVAGNSLVALNEQDLSPLWTSNQAAPMKGLILNSGTGFCVSENKLLALDLNEEGKLLWTYDAKAKLFPPIQTLDHIVTLDEKGTLHRIKKRDGEEELPLTPIAGIVSRPPVLHGTTLIYHVNNFILCLNVNSGDEIWRQDISKMGTVVSPLVAQQGTLCFLARSPESVEGLKNPVQACFFAIADRARGGIISSTSVIGVWGDETPLRFGALYFEQEGAIVFPLLQGIQDLRRVRFPLVILPPPPDQGEKRVAMMQVKANVMADLWRGAVNYRKDLDALYASGVRGNLPEWEERTRYLPGNLKAVPGLSDGFFHQRQPYYLLLRETSDQIQTAMDNWSKTYEAINSNLDELIKYCRIQSLEWSAFPPEDRIQYMGSFQLETQYTIPQILKLRSIPVPFDQGNGEIDQLLTLVGTITMSAETLNENELIQPAIMAAFQGNLHTAVETRIVQPVTVVYPHYRENDGFISTGVKGGWTSGRILLAYGSRLEVHRGNFLTTPDSPDGFTGKMVNILPKNLNGPRGSTISAIGSSTVIRTYDPGIVSSMPPLVLSTGDIYLGGTHRGKPMVGVYKSLDLKTDPNLPQTAGIGSETPPSVALSESN